MPRVKLTDRFVQSAKTTTPSRVDFSDESQRGLVLRVTSSGARTYTATYFRDGKRQRVTLGPAMFSPSRTPAREPQTSELEFSAVRTPLQRSGSRAPQVRCRATLRPRPSRRPFKV